ncbi:hypothetical protein GGS23DRAFT_567315 [Durotheca rogersii]|uniref:uncharacterized protein n=1 Tax=Durotheca rogersii TaxID=419775 RepID=UPI00221F7F46|nr:uncharacterized protein GGS23DRAFT_567315 [Durotheca rogersii]KAI5863496.1 hypothetical protein GGS23DRAFT_567315 [Durotheca rogersii]
MLEPQMNTLSLRWSLCVREPSRMETPPEFPTLFTTYLDLRSESPMYICNVRMDASVENVSGGQMLVSPSANEGRTQLACHDLLVGGGEGLGFMQTNSASRRRIEPPPTGGAPRSQGRARSSDGLHGPPPGSSARCSRTEQAQTPKKSREQGEKENPPASWDGKRLAPPRLSAMIAASRLLSRWRGCRKSIPSPRPGPVCQTWVTQDYIYNTHG